MFMFFLFFFKLLNIAFSLIPFWNFKESSIDLLPEKKDGEKNSIKLSENQYWGSKQTSSYVHLILNKNFSRNGENIEIQNYISMLDNEGYKEIDWEIAEGYFFDNVGHFVCPKSKGKFFLNQYSNRNYNYIQPSDFSYNSNNKWELNCFKTCYIDNSYYMIEGFLGMNVESDKNFFAKMITTDLKYETNWMNKKIDDRLLDFLWPDETFEAQKFYMYSLTLKGNKICLHNFIIQIGGTTMESYSKDSIELGTKAEYAYAYFNHTNKTFYWMMANSIDDFESGYSTESLNLYINNINVQKESFKGKSPFRILNKDVRIKKLEMIRNTRFVYYELYYNNDESIIYRGIIDIELNSIIFHTNETFKEVIPLNFSLVAVTDETAYQICAIKNDGICVERCPSNKNTCLDTIKGNFCGRSCSCSKYGYTLLPNDICIEECRSDIYYINKQTKECGLCMDINDKKPFKFINKNECLDTKPYNTYFVYEKYKIIDYCSEGCKECEEFETCDKCEDGYKLTDDDLCEPINCYKTCETCSSFSDKENDQKCTKCKEGYYLFGNNCLKSCKDGFYKDDNNRNCSSCHENCKKCSKGPVESNENCDSCESGFYLINIVNFDRNCTANCPNGTFKNTKKNECLDEEEEEEDTLILWIYVIIIGFLLLIISICIYRKIFGNNKTDSELINDIATELQHNNRLIQE